jgi:hypothetical protein
LYSSYLTLYLALYYHFDAVIDFVYHLALWLPSFIFFVLILMYLTLYIILFGFVYHFAHFDLVCIQFVFICNWLCISFDLVFGFVHHFNLVSGFVHHFDLVFGFVHHFDLCIRLCTSFDISWFCVQPIKSSDARHYPIYCRWNHNDILCHLILICVMFRRVKFICAWL